MKVWAFSYQWIASGHLREKNTGMRERMCSGKNSLHVQKLQRIIADSQSCRGMRGINPFCKNTNKCVRILQEE